MTAFFEIVYALVIAVACGLVGLLPGFLLGLAAPRDHRLLLLPGVGVALAGWIWIGWLGELYGISRLGLVVFTGLGAAGFVRGWATGLRAGGRARARCSRTRASLR